MKNIRIGNDIRISWNITRDGLAYPLDGLDIKVYLGSPFGKTEIKDYTIKGNQILWTYYGKDQKYIGKHSLILVVNEDENGMMSTDKCNFVNLVQHTCNADGADDENVTTENVDLASDIVFGTYDDTELRNLISEKQDALVSGENIKTINGESILGKGNITIQGGGGAEDALIAKEVIPSLFIDNGESFGNQEFTEENKAHNAEVFKYFTSDGRGVIMFFGKTLECKDFHPDTDPQKDALVFDAINYIKGSEELSYTTMSLYRSGEATLEEYTISSGGGLKYSEERTVYVNGGYILDEPYIEIEIPEEQREYNKETLRKAFNEEPLTINFGGQFTTEMTFRSKEGGWKKDEVSFSAYGFIDFLGWTKQSLTVDEDGNGILRIEKTTNFGGLKYSEERTAYPNVIKSAEGYEAGEITDEQKAYNTETLGKVLAEEPVIVNLFGTLFEVASWSNQTKECAFHANVPSIDYIQYIYLTIKSSGECILEIYSRPISEGGGSIDTEALEAYMPLAREFSDDFNNDFAR